MNKYSKIVKSILTLISFLSFGISVKAQDVTSATSNTSNDSFLSSPDLALYVLAGVIILFVFIIFVLSGAVKIASKTYMDKLRKERTDKSKVISLIILFSMLSDSLSAETTIPVNAPNAFANLDLYILGTTVFILFIVVLVLVRTLFILMGIKKEEKAILSADGSPSKVRTWFQKFNETVPIEDEESLDMSHDYDGIRELDNKIPSWWSWAFFTFVAFGAVYLYRMFVTETLPNQFEELAQANEIAAVQKMEYLKKGANNVDENTVVMLAGPEIAEGANIYAKNCIACHGDKGQGGVGPNLTDDYWLHKGGIKDVFYSIKYGWQEKGMKSWKDDFSPGQIAQLSSYIMTMHGTNPPGAKEKQGELYTEETSEVTDSTKTITSADSAVVK
jgi:cytochrome c oxidase cbb3-type subunit 3